MGRLLDTFLATEDGSSLFLATPSGVNNRCISAFADASTASAPSGAQVGDAAEHTPGTLKDLNSRATKLVSTAKMYLYLACAFSGLTAMLCTAAASAAYTTAHKMKSEVEESEKEFQYYLGVMDASDSEVENTAAWNGSGFEEFFPL